MEPPAQKRYAPATVIENRSLGPGIFVITLEGCDHLSATLPGQFVMLRDDAWGTDPLLPRAFSLLSCDGPRADILLKASGKASSLLEHVLPGARFSVLGPLGNSFPVPSAERRDWLVAGGVGLAPLMMHAARAGAMGLGTQCTMFYGGRTASDLVLLDEIRATGAALELATEDGELGARGYVTRALEQALAVDSGAPPTLLACGPDPMLEAVARLARSRGLKAYLSLEGEMACGIGACLACAVPCVSRPFRYTCVDGPVLPLEDLAGRFATGAQS